MLCHLEGVEAFEHQWNLLVVRFGLVSDKHIALLSSYRASWPFSYIRGYFLAWTMTIEFSQSLETFLKRILSGQTCLQVFFEQVRAAANFGNLTREGMQYMHIKTCMPIEEHARSILTPYAFRVIQHEIELSMQYATRMDGEYLVIWIPEDEQIHCSFNVIQGKKLDQPLSLCGSVLRSPHWCNAQYMANMGSIASLVMSVTINGEDDEQDEDQQKGRKLWGLVVCHHTSQREKHIMQTQTLLCDMLLRDSPVGIVAQSPNVKDLVKCDGAALYYGKKLWLLGVTPTEAQIKDIADWLLECHSASTGLSTDSLVEAGYPDASLLGDAVCGMAAVRITSKDFLFWFRSHTAKQIKWGGAKHDPGDENDGRKMHPRSSFKAFLEVVKQRSLPWEDVEMDAIHSLQLILRGSLQDEVVEESKIIVNVPSIDDKIERVDELRIITNEMVRLIETAAVPIMAVDACGSINGWNSKVAELTGLAVEQAIGTPFIDLVDENSVDVVKKMLSMALLGIEERNVEIKLKTFGPLENSGPVILVVNACCTQDAKENVVGVCFVGQDITGQKLITDKYTRIQGDYVNIVRSPSALIPPIFMTDEHGRCMEWNDAMEKLSGLKREEATDRMLLGEVFTVNSFGCRVKNVDTLTKLRIILNRVIAGQDADKLLFGFFDQQGKYVEGLLSANKRTDAEGNLTGALCFLHVTSPELQYALQVQRISEQAAANSFNKLAYIRREIKKPLGGIAFMQDLRGSSDLSKEQKQLLKTSLLCQEQLTKIVDDNDIESIEECYMEMKSCEFNLAEALEAVMTQVMILSKEHQVQLIRDLPDEVSSMNLYGDRVIPRKQRIGKKIHIVHLEFRITHPAPGIPEKLIHEMFYHSQGSSREGLCLYMCQKLVKIMNGTVQYVREAEKSSFIILIEFPLAL
ncbi:hypothetical protein LWI28_015678 [Acer negundo]|uniref:Phytochrome n=1 Tax=Acer negundo TaxID=4023 RepID=A0AAD5NS89_ACENE|nr:hypothetical protein LWI28_015678 [Acer negundo]